MRSRSSIRGRFDGALVHGELLAKRDVLERELGPGLEHELEQGQQDGEVRRRERMPSMGLDAQLLHRYGA